MSTQSSAHPITTDLAFTRPSPYGTLAEPTYSGALSFLRRRYTKDLAGADVAVVGVPFDLATAKFVKGGAERLKVTEIMAARLTIVDGSAA